MARVNAEVQKLVDYFANEGWSRFGFRGDGDGLSPANCAIRAMREYDNLLKTKLGEAALITMQYNQLQRAGLVP